MKIRPSVDGTRDPSNMRMNATRPEMLSPKMTNGAQIIHEMA
jgi:hypothetical protein